MKKHFLILLFSAITFCASSQVTIPDSVARFYLEQNEKVKVYEQIVVTKGRQISILEKKIFEQLTIIRTYESDKKSYRGIINLNTDQLAFKDKQLAAADKEIRRVKRQRNIVAGAGGGAAIGSVLGPEGAVIGGVIGGSIGLVISWIRK